jgi:hypothetical protein
MTSSHRIEIEELVLRMPGVTKEETPALVEDVLRRVQDRLRGSKRRGDIRLAQLAVELPSAGGRQALIDALVDALEGALR